MERIEKSKKIQRFAYVLMLLCLLSGCGQEEGVLFFDSESAGQEGALADASSEEPKDASVEGEGGAPQSQIYVQVSGAVASPGVYALPGDARIFQAIELAGGLAPEADARSLNQAEPLKDGQMVYVMSQEEAAQAALAQEGQGGEGADGKVNLNTATESDLMALPGIGAAKAKSILAWREENGGFSQVEDLMKIQGIKEGVFSKIKDSIKVE